MTARDRYLAALHAMQSGVAMEMNYDPSPTDPKHLRVGVNAAMVDNSALAHPLIKKGLITQEEYLEALAEMAEAEQKNYEQRISRRVGKPISLA